jgi:CHASE2 domain-containing sensor protein/serine phosphatase RsbU (regulator of sigma subunit)
MMGSVSISKGGNGSGSSDASLSRSPLILAVLLGAIVGTLLTIFAGDFERRTVFDNWQRAAPREISTDEVVVVMIDDESIAATTSWPWPRYQTAQLIEQVAAANPAAIGIDIYFVDPDPSRPSAFAGAYLEEELDPETRSNILNLPNMDDYLASTFGRVETVIARVAVEEGGIEASELFYSSAVKGEPPPATTNADQVLASITELDGAAPSQAFVNAPPDGDGVVRRVPLSIQVSGTHVPGFAAELARIATQSEKIEWDGAGMLVGEQSVPVDQFTNMQFKMLPNEQIPRYSAVQLFSSDFDQANLEGKVVIIGLGAEGTYDIVATPHESAIYGVLVQAMAVDAILKGEWLSRPQSMVVLEILCAALLVLLVLLAGIRGRKILLLLTFGIAILMPMGSFLLYSHANLLFDPVRPLLIGASAAIALGLTQFARARAMLVEERVRASEQKGELDAARRIQMSMVPGAKTLSRLDDRTEVGAVLEPAKSVGGDFFDAIKINKDLLLFMVGDVTGKGVPAALFMALSKTLSKSNLARAEDGLEAAVAAINLDLMDEADDEMGLTMLVGTIDCRSGAMELVNAGHENPIIMKKDGSVDIFEMKGGPPFCVIDFPYRVEPINLAEGDSMIIITDGATEAANEANELFGMSGVLGALNAESDGTASSRASHLAKEVRLFEGDNDPTDDLTIFALRYVGSR